MGMYTNPSRRTGLAGVAARAVIDGTIASSSGRAKLAPIPLRNVRRGKALLVMIILNSSFGKAHYLQFLGPEQRSDSRCRAHLPRFGELPERRNIPFRDPERT